MEDSTLNTTIPETWQILTNTPYLIRTACYFLLSTGTVIVNLLSLYTLYQRKATRPSAKFVYNMSIENVTLACPVIILAALTSVSFIAGDIWCRLFAVLLVAHILATSVNGLVISVDRYIAIKKALHYTNWMTHRVCILIITLEYAACIAIALILSVDWSVIAFHPGTSLCMIDHNVSSGWKAYVMALIGVAFILPLLTNIYIYSAIYMITKNTTALARRNSIQPLLEQSLVRARIVSLVRNESNLHEIHAKTLLLRAHGNVYASSSMPTYSSTARPVPERQSSFRRLSGQLRVHKDNRKAAKMGLLVIGTQIFLWLPFYVFLVLQTFDISKPSRLDWLTVICIFSDGIVNPVVYILRSKSAKAIICSWSKKSVPVETHVKQSTTCPSRLTRQISEGSY